MRNLLLQLMLKCDIFKVAASVRCVSYEQRRFDLHHCHYFMFIYLYVQWQETFHQSYNTRTVQREYTLNHLAFSFFYLQFRRRNFGM